MIAQDAAYNEMTFSRPRASLLQVPARRTWRSSSTPLEDLQHDGLAGRLRDRRPLISALGQVKANTDSGIFTAIQFAAKTALDEFSTLTPPIRALYEERRDAFVAGMRRIGWDVPSPEATFYVWMPCPPGYTSTELCGRLLDEADVVTTPGLGFGRTADGYIRAALTVETPRLIEAVERIGRLSL
ncbi:MAG: aminotransferase class I/II-fold pyridoxal phosphate-dependent enzyme [Singulisphaera sp.]